MENLKVLFPVHIRKKIKNNLWLNDLEEIRIRAGQPIELAYSGKTRYLTDMDGEMCACVRESVQNARACYRITGADIAEIDRKSTRLNSSHKVQSRMPSSA